MMDKLVSYVQMLTFQRDQLTLQHIRDFTEQLQKISDQKTLCQFFSDQIQQRGYHQFDAFALLEGSESHPKQPGNFFVCDYFLGHALSFVSEGWLQLDPCVPYIGQTSQPFDYIHFLKSNLQNSSVKWQLRMLRFERIRHAWCIPLNIRGATRAVTLYLRGKGLETTEHFEQTRFEMQLISTEFMARLTHLQGLESEKFMTVKPIPELSPRELDCLHWVARGKTNAEIGVILSISENTVRFHMKNLFQKLDVRTRSDAVRTGLRHGLLIE